MENVKYVNQKLMRYGYTTGSCATAAAKAAAQMLLSGQIVTHISIMTPKGIQLDLEICDTKFGPDFVSCAVKKDGGDDPDITNGLYIYAHVSKMNAGIEITGGVGVGQVTKPGLDQPVGNAAINSVPRKMIRSAVDEITKQFHYTGGLKIIISVPGGMAIGNKTLNPHIGIVGGISILGTTGIVEPMSAKALVDSTRLELKMLKTAGVDDLLLTIGNYGMRFAQNHLNLDLQYKIKCSNFIGETLDAAIELGFQRVLIIGHIGKMVKLGAGIMNTHSSNGDARLEIMTACALRAGADMDTLRAVIDCATTDAALEVLAAVGILDRTMTILSQRIEYYLQKRIGNYMEFGALVFTDNVQRSQTLCTCGNADALLNIWRKSHDT
jgi:cobalt-precorrin-5B (C1)-methyltransferase